MLADDDLAKTASYYLMKLGSWIETACPRLDWRCDQEW
jgi:hypothetical protein